MPLGPLGVLLGPLRLLGEPPRDPKRHPRGPKRHKRGTFLTPKSETDAEHQKDARKVEFEDGFFTFQGLRLVSKIPEATQGRAKSPQEHPKSEPRAPKRAQEAPKSNPRSPKRA